MDTTRWVVATIGVQPTRAESARDGLLLRRAGYGELRQSFTGG